MKIPFAMCLLLLSAPAAAQELKESTPIRLPLCIDDLCSFVNEDGEKVLTGCDKTSASYLGFKHIAAARLWPNQFVNRA